MTFRWGEDTTFKFVSEYIKHESLWNIKCLLYKNKQAKLSACNEIQKIMNIPGFGEKEIKLKIKNIRSTYSQELKKIKDSKRSGAGTDTIYVPSIKWFNILDDTLRYINSELTESHSNLSNTDNENNISVTETEQTENTTELTLNSEFCEPKPKNKKQRLSQLKTMVTELKGITEAVNSPVEGEFEVFGKHIGLQLQSMPLLLALEAQEHIQVYLNRLRRQHLQNSSDQNIIITRSSTPSVSSYTQQDSPYSSASTYSYFNSQSREDTECSSQSIPQTQQYNIQHTTMEDISTSIIMPSFQGLQNSTTTNDIIATAINNANVDF